MPDLFSDFTIHFIILVFVFPPPPPLSSPRDIDSDAQLTVSVDSDAQLTVSVLAWLQRRAKTVVCGLDAGAQDQLPPAASTRQQGLFIGTQ